MTRFMTGKSARSISGENEKPTPKDSVIMVEGESLKRYSSDTMKVLH